MRLSAFWACVQLISDSVAGMPLKVYRRMDDGGKREAPWHSLYYLLHDRPNEWQTAMEWRQQMTVHLLLRGNAYARIYRDVARNITGLETLHPDAVTEPKNPDQPFSVRTDSGKPIEIPWGDVFVLRGMQLGSSVRGASVLEYARESLGIGLATEEYAGRVFSNDGRPRGVLEHPGKLSQDAATRLKESWQESYAGLGNAHKVAVLQEGLKFNAISVSPDDAQMLASREWTAEQVCMWLRVPPHMVGLTSKATSWGSGIEQLGIGFVQHTLLPHIRRWEQAIGRDLFSPMQDENRRYFAEHNVDGLTRGDIKTRYEAYSIGRQMKWLSANDVRRFENLNPIPGGDSYENPAITVTPAPAGSAAVTGNDWQAHLIELAGERTNGHADH